MGNGDIVVGSNPSSRKPATIIGDTAGTASAAPRTNSDPVKAERGCGAMSQQRGDSGAASTPQKFVRLVGCREPKVRPPGGR